MKRWLIAALALVTPAVAQAQDAARKPLVSVNGIEDMAKSGQAQAFAKMIETAITNTGKFRVLEDDHGKLLQRQDKAAAGIITTRTPGKRGGFTGADFLIYGTITTASLGNKIDRAGNVVGGALKDIGGMFGRRTGLGSAGSAFGEGRGNCSKATASLAIDVKIVDGETGEIRYAQSLNPSADAASSCTGDVALDYGILLRSAATKIAGALVTTSYPIKVAAVLPDGTVLLNYGQGVLQVGDVLTIFGAGEKVVDPDTGAVLSDGEGMALGNIRVVDVQAKFSKAQSIGNFVSAPAKGAIVRPEVAAIKPNGKRR